MIHTVAVVGCGPMGGHHARAVASHPDLRLIAVVDHHPERADRLAALVGTQGAVELPVDAELVIVATPASAHIEVARAALARGAWCLVEKPLAPTAAEAEELRGARVMPAMIERFNPALPANLPPWTSLRIERLVPPADRASDVDALADLAVHDLDLLLSRGIALDEMVGEGALRRIQGGPDEVRMSVALGGRQIELHICKRAASARRRWTLETPSGRVSYDLAKWRRPGRDPLHRQLDAVIARLRGRGKPSPSVHDSLCVLSVIDELRQRLERKPTSGKERSG